MAWKGGKQDPAPAKNKQAVAGNPILGRCMQNTGEPGSHTILKADFHPGDDISFSECAKPHFDAAPVLILDAEGINFDSMLIGELVNLQREFEKAWSGRETRLILVNLSDFNKRVFEQVHLENIFHIHDTIQEALATL